MLVLITGANGQLGRDLTDVCLTAGDRVVALTSAQLDVSDRSAVAEAIGSYRPDVVVNSAAWTAVDDCEADPRRALRVNGAAVRWLADASRRHGAHLVQVSTDYVFDGTKVDPYHEWDETCPTSAYGRSKLAGEREALLGAPGATVVRTAWLCGRHGSNMVKTVLGLRDRDSLAFVDDQRGCPTFTADLAATIRTLAAERLPGTFHVTNAGAVSWYEFVREILVAAGADPGIVRPIATSELHPPRPAPRPANSVLENAALALAGLPPLPDHREPLERVVKALLA